MVKLGKLPEGTQVDLARSLTPLRTGSNFGSVIRWIPTESAAVMWVGRSSARGGELLESGKFIFLNGTGASPAGGHLLAIAGYSKL